MKKSLLLLTALVMTLLLSGCSLFPAKDADIVSTKKSNPASDNCVDRGGTLEIRENAEGGKFGVCIFEDGSECEEWAYFHGLCKPGEQEEVEDSSDVTTPDDAMMEEDEMKEEEREETPETDEDDAPDQVATTSDNISVDYPTTGTQLSSPFEVTGTADISGDTIYVDVTTLDGAPLIQQSTSTNNSGDFKQKIFYEFSSTKEGYVEVYSKDSSGDKVNVVKIPVTF